MKARIRRGHKSVGRDHRFFTWDTPHIDENLLDTLFDCEKAFKQEGVIRYKCVAHGFGLLTEDGKGYGNGAVFVDEGGLIPLKKSDSEDPFWIVWNDRRDSANFPTCKHPTFKEASDEAARLANKHPGTKFYVLMATQRVCSHTVVEKDTVG